MMYKKPSSRKAALKALYLLPCSLLALTVFAKPTVINEIQETLVQEESVAPLLSPQPIVENVVAEEPAPLPEPEPVAAEEPEEKEDTQSAKEDKKTDSLELLEKAIANQKTALEYTLDSVNAILSSGSSDKDIEDIFEEIQKTRAQAYLNSLKSLHEKGYVIASESERYVILRHYNTDRTIQLAKEFSLTKSSDASKTNKVEDKKDNQSTNTVGVYPRKINRNYKAKDLPENRAPKIVREKGSNYDYFDHETFPVYEDFQYTDIPRGKEIWPRTNVEIYLSKKVTYVVFYKNSIHHDNDEWVFYLFPSNYCIVDPDTDERYQIRKLHHYPLDTFILHHNNAQSIHVFIAEFPPLPKAMDRIQFEYPNTPARKWWPGGASKSKVFWLSELCPPNM